MNCPICHAGLTDTQKNIVVVCPACNNSLFTYKDKKKQFKLFPFYLNINVCCNRNMCEELCDEDADEFAEDESDFEGYQFEPKL